MNNNDVTWYILRHAREPIRFSSRDIGSLSRMFQLDDMPLVTFPATTTSYIFVMKWCHYFCVKRKWVWAHTIKIVQWKMQNMGKWRERRLQPIFYFRFKVTIFQKSKNLKVVQSQSFHAILTVLLLNILFFYHATLKNCTETQKFPSLTGQF